MTTISAASFNPQLYSAPKVTLNPASETAVRPQDMEKDAKAEDKNGLRVDMKNGKIDPTAGPGDLVEQLQKQIEQTEKMLAQQQAQLSSVQRGQASEERRALQAMEVQSAITVTNATLQALQAALLQATVGSINTTA